MLNAKLKNAKSFLSKSTVPKNEIYDIGSELVAAVK